MKYDTVVIGGGNSGCAAAREALEKGLKVCLVAAGLPIEVTDESRKKAPYERIYALTKMGADVFRGDRVTGGRWEGNVLKEVYTSNGLRLQAKNFVLATGHFFGKGLISTADSVREAVFDADVDFPQDRSKWFDPDFFAPQPFESFGVRTSPEGNIIIKGEAAANVRAAGKILGIRHNDRN